MRQTSIRVDKFYRWVWDEKGRYTTNVCGDDGTDRELVCDDTEYSNNTLSNVQNAFSDHSKWLDHEHGTAINWNLECSFNAALTNVRDYFAKDERRKIREAALESESIPSYNSLTPKERDEWKTHLSQQFEKPKDEITKADWDRASRWKTVSMVWTAVDTGL